MPLLGLGTFKVAEGPELEHAVRTALEIGYRHIDTASLYGNETGIGKAVRESDVSRDEIFITTKVWNDEQGEPGTLAALDRSLARLGMDFVDLYLVHWPLPNALADTWRAMERALESGKARTIGVSNFLVPHLTRLAEFAEVAPMVDQVEHHPRLPQPALRSYLREAGIALEAWSPLMRGEVADIPEIVAVAKRHNKTPAQVALRWALQHGVVVIPKSVQPSRIAENADLFDFELTQDDMGAIDALDAGEAGRTSTHPDHFADAWPSG